MMQITVPIQNSHSFYKIILKYTKWVIIGFSVFQISKEEHTKLYLL